MATWVVDGLDKIRGDLATRGFAPSFPRAPVHCRWMGGPAASGARMAIFTVQDLRAAEAAYQVTWAWWSRVPTTMDERGWRGVSQKWQMS